MSKSFPNFAKLIGKNSELSGTATDLRSLIKILELVGCSLLFASALLGFGRVDNPICLSSRFRWRSLTSIPNSFARCFPSQFAVHRRKE
jgi:hypothetical protein